MPGHVMHRGGSGEPLVLLHGFSDSWRTWRLVLPELEKHHEVFVLAQPGHVDGPDYPADLPATADNSIDLIERDLDSVGLDKAHLAGNSLGGWVALLLAARGRASSVVGLCPAGGWGPSGSEHRRINRFFSRQRQLLKIGGPNAKRIARYPRLRALAFRDVMASGARNVTAEDAFQMMDAAWRCPIYDRALETARSTGLGDMPPEPDCPVRIVYGTKDKVIRFPQSYKRLQEGLPHADWVGLEGIGHLPQWDDPDLTVRTILEFTQAKSAAPAPAA